MRRPFAVRDHQEHEVFYPGVFCGPRGHVVERVTHGVVYIYTPVVHDQTVFVQFGSPVEGAGTAIHQARRASVRLSLGPLMDLETSAGG